ncbi:mycofactocin precursor MftA [Streptomyces sp. NPDC004539]
MHELRSEQSEETVETDAPPLIEAEDLLEEISIDGMCGVY